MTGTTARGGATWRYILQDQDKKTKNHTLLRRNSPLLSQVLHFLDYKVSPNGVKNWREKSIKGLYNEQIDKLNYTAPLFLDSGGFKLMYRTGLDLGRYDISLEPSNEAKSILMLQRDLGGDIVATLDYPLPPNLLPSEARKRRKRSRHNAIEAAKLLRDDPDFKDYAPFLYMAVHGTTTRSISAYVRELFSQIDKQSLFETNFGLAVGSLVPLRRGLQKNGLMVNLIRAATRSIPDKFRDRVPMHIFGVTGLMVPFLVYLGVDTFDSSTFVQEARSLKYVLPETFERQNIMEMASNDITCTCFVCQNLRKETGLQTLKESLMSPTVGKPQKSGFYKSKYYADIALHNLELELNVLKKTRMAIEADALDQYLIEISKNSPRMRDVLTAVAQHDPSLKRKASRTVYLVSQRLNFVNENPPRYISLSHTPDDFNINANGYKPKGNKPILLIIPCSREKPYSNSHTHQHLAKYLEKSLPNWQSIVDKVTLSGLYGPVPFECEKETAVLEYEFWLKTDNVKQIEECTNRLVAFLTKHGKQYAHCIAYGTSNAYRTVFEKTAKHYPELKIFPNQPKARRLNEFFRLANIEELLAFITSTQQETK